MKKILFIIGILWICTISGYGQSLYKTFGKQIVEHTPVSRQWAMGWCGFASIETYSNKLIKQCIPATYYMQERYQYVTSCCADATYNELNACKSMKGVIYNDLGPLFGKYCMGFCFKHSFYDYYAGLMAETMKSTEDQG